MKSSAHRIMHRVTAAISSLSRQLIELTTMLEEITDAQVDFNAIASFPRVISALDCHDSSIFQNSRLRARLEAGTVGDGIILADGGCALKLYLITSLQNHQNDAERLLNESQIRTRNTVERTFGVWKRRFPCLATGMRFLVDHVLLMIVAIAVLHHKARRRLSE
ncbi:putative nuclease HARBI1 [Belonocnema kinseyi]|uniref:putative nuclease HARBI1 n=1 Tax=Belonocnema kinseyi TaxID=2817044 RepID=UPI00143DE5D3|nr:putative nuclease HARBI1 [Belonocnema kinseyi]